MKTKLMICMGVIFFSGISLVKAQSASDVAKQIRVGINLEGAFPTGDFGKSYSFGIGGSIMGQYALSSQANLTASLGYLSFSGKSITFDEGEGTSTIKIPSTHGIPLRVGANYGLGENFFVQGEIGASFMKGTTAFLYTPGIGVRFDQFELEAKYEGWSAKGGTLSFAGIRIGYFF